MHVPPVSNPQALALKQHNTFLSAQPSELGLDWARPCANVELDKWYRSECTALSPPVTPSLPNKSKLYPKKGWGNSRSQVLEHRGVKRGQCFVGMQCTGNAWHDCSEKTR